MAVAFSCKDSGADASQHERERWQRERGGQVGVCFQPRIGRNGRGYGEDVVPALNGADAGATSDMRPCVAVHRQEGEITERLASTGAGKANSESPPPPTQVRRLTPRECERLQGFPDDYTRIATWKGWRPMDEDETPEGCIAAGLEVRQNKKTGKWRVRDVDGPRYKALGNSMAVPCMRWIGERIAMVERLTDEATAGHTTDRESAVQEGKR